MFTESALLKVVVEEFTVRLKFVVLVTPAPAAVTVMG
jgi:hypothetical protein